MGQSAVLGAGGVAGISEMAGSKEVSDWSSQQTMKRVCVTRQWVKKRTTDLNLKPPQQNAVRIIYAFNQ